MRGALDYCGKSHLWATSDIWPPLSSSPYSSSISNPSKIETRSTRDCNDGEGPADGEQSLLFYSSQDATNSHSIVHIALSLVLVPVPKAMALPAR